MLLFMEQCSEFTMKVVIFISIFSVSVFATEDADESFPARFNLTSLNGKNGFVVNGVSSGVSCGTSISGAGDVNGDGVDDILIGAPYDNEGKPGQSYVVFGSKSEWPAIVDLSNLNGNNGFVINGINSNEGNGLTVSGAGDVNADGIDDFLIGTQYGYWRVGQSYVVFGKKLWPAVVELRDLDGSNGFIIHGIVTTSGYFVSGVGDVNGDGINDILIGGLFADNSIGQAYVVFGGKKQHQAIFELEDLNGSNGFVINGLKTGIIMFVSGAGDINGDGVVDILIGAWDAHTVGQGYVVFGSKGEWPVAINLVDLNGNNGFVINALDYKNDNSRIISGAGDVNGDGIADILIGSPQADFLRGKSYVVFGNRRPWPAAINVTNLSGKNGVTFNGMHEGDLSGCSVSGVGDVNEDGIDDVIIGAPYVNGFRGQVYIIFGSKKLWPVVFNLKDLDGKNGFIISSMQVDKSGWSVSGAGDVNGDGTADILIGAPYGNNLTGRSYVIFGGNKRGLK